MEELDPSDDMALCGAVMRSFQFLDQHLCDRHPGGIQELWMERNWPLQELLLSNTVKFAVCEEVIDPTLPSRGRWEGMPASLDTTKARTTIFDLGSLAQTWVGSSDRESDSTGRSEELDLIEDFLAAFRFNGTVIRPSAREWNPNLLDQLSRSSNNIRKSGKARDYILAVLPQFAWYRLPLNIKSMEFGQIYQDAMLQIEDKYYEKSQQKEGPARNRKIRPKITKGILGGLSVDCRSSSQPSSNIPLPECLGDVCKSMHFVGEADTLQTSPELDQLLLQPVDAEGLIAHVLALVSDSIWFANLNLQAEWFYQFAMWRNDLPQLLKLISGMNPDVPELSEISSEPSSQARHELPLLVTQVIIEIFRLQAAASGESLQNIFKELSSITLSSVQDATSQAILRKASSLDQDWTKTFNLCAKGDSPAFRTLLLTTTVALCCGFGMSAGQWLSEKLQVYLLMGHDVANGRILQTLVFGAKGLDVDNLDGIQAFTGDIQPYIAVDSAGCSSKHVLGLAPKPGKWSTNPCQPDAM
jgi:hypothetical protein